MITPPSLVLTIPGESQIEEKSTSEWEEGSRRRKGGESKKRPAGSPTGDPGEYGAKRNCEMEISNPFQPLSGGQGSHWENMEEGKEVEEDEPGRVDGENLDDGTDTVNTNSEEEKDMSNEGNLPQAQKLPQLDGHIEHEQDNYDEHKTACMAQQNHIKLWGRH